MTTCCSSHYIPLVLLLGTIRWRCVRAPFIEPDASLQQLASLEAVVRALNMTVLSGHRADFSAFKGKSHAFDRLIDAVATTGGGYEDQSSAAYYYDVFSRVHATRHAIGRIVELGVFMGGTTQIFAGIAEHAPSLEVHLVDVDEAALQCAYERTRRTFPSASSRLRLFRGALPVYVRDVILAEHANTSSTSSRLFVHHDASHDFNHVVRDLASLYFVGERLHSVGVQDTHLRGAPRHPNFVDLAVRAVFGSGMVFEEMGAAYGRNDSLMMNPNRWDGEYFLPDVYEGVYLPMDRNSFSYPHARHSIDDFIMRRAG